MKRPWHKPPPKHAKPKTAKQLYFQDTDCSSCLIGLCHPDEWVEECECPCNPGTSNVRIIP